MFRLCSEERPHPSCGYTPPKRWCPGAQLGVTKGTGVLQSVRRTEKDNIKFRCMSRFTCSYQVLEIPVTILYECKCSLLRQIRCLIGLSWWLKWGGMQIVRGGGGGEGGCRSCLKASFRAWFLRHYMKSFPAGTHDAIMTSLWWRRFGVIMTLLLRRVPVGLLSLNLYKTN